MHIHLLIGIPFRWATSSSILKGSRDSALGGIELKAERAFIITFNAGGKGNTQQITGNELGKLLMMKQEEKGNGCLDD